MNNMLIDPASKRIIALFDFDFAFISHPCQEYFTSLGDVGGDPSGLFGRDPTNGRLAHALLTGDFEATDLPEEAIGLWTSARTFDKALRSRGTTRLCEMTGVSVLDKFRRLEFLLCPFRLVHPFFLAKKTPEQIEEERAVAENNLLDCLSSLDV